MSDYIKQPKALYKCERGGDCAGIISTDGTNSFPAESMYRVKSVTGYFCAYCCPVHDGDIMILQDDINAGLFSQDDLNAVLFIPDEEE